MRISGRRSMIYVLNYNVVVSSSQSVVVLLLKLTLRVETKLKLNIKINNKTVFTAYGNVSYGSERLRTKARVKKRTEDLP